MDPIASLDIEDAYEAARGPEPLGLVVRGSLSLRHWILSKSKFDPRTGDPLPLSLGQICRTNGQPREGEAPKDRVFRLLQHSTEALGRVIRKMNERLARQHAMLPLHAVRELDSASFMALSRRPGRNIREKLAGRPRLQAVKRSYTLDNSENRLVKAFVERITELFRLRTKCQLGRESLEVLETLESLDLWLMRPEIREIGRWQGLTPNNVLLEHRTYGAVWKAWVWAQTIDNDLRSDISAARSQWAIALFWEVLGRLNSSPSVRMLEQPCSTSYEGFSIRPVLSSAPLLPTVSGLVSEGEAFASPTWVPISVELGEDSSIRVLKGGSAWLQVIPQKGSGSFVAVLVGRRLIQAPCSAEGAASIADAALVELGLSEPIQGDLDREDAINSSARVHKVVDLASFPTSVLSDRAADFARHRLLVQIWDKGSSRMVLNLAQCNAFALHADAATHSLMSLVANEWAGNDSERGRVSRAVADVLSDASSARSITYLVPDSTSDFELSALRSSLNARFESAEPLPRSVAAVFKWQNSPGFANPDVRPNDCVLVLDAVGDSLTATPMIACAHPALDRLLPRGRGIYWERCPSLDGGDEQSSAVIAARVLEACGCPDANEIGSLFGVEGLLNEAPKLSWLSRAGDWYTSPADLEQVVKLHLESLDPWAGYGSELDEHFRELAPGARVFTIMVGRTLADIVRMQPPEGRLSGHRTFSVGGFTDVTSGGLVLKNWQALAPGIPLWRDRLPELSIRVHRDGRSVPFHLVSKGSQNSVTPIRGKPVELPIDDVFTLPAGQAEYRFPIEQGSEGRELRYIAQIRSPRLPFDEDVEARLRLMYTYGEEHPYQLTVHPIGDHDADPAVLQIAWVPRVESASYPAFPPAASWEILEQFPKEGSHELNDLTEWIERSTGFIARNAGEIVNRTPYSEWAKPAPDSESTYMLSSLKGIRFPLLTVLRARSVDDPQMPVRLARTLDRLAGICLDIFPILESERVAKMEYGADLYVLACLQRADSNAVQAALNRLPSTASTSMVGYAGQCVNSCGFALGALVSEWQQELFAAVETEVFSGNVARCKIGLSILAVAIWRNEGFLSAVAPSTLLRVAKALAKALARCVSEKEWLRSGDRNWEGPRVLAHELELLLGLLRTRALPDDETRRILAPGLPLTREFERLVNRIDSGLAQSRVDVPSRISIELDKPLSLNKTPDLLYALRLYLTGDSGATAIQVQGVTDRA